jgi:hypothetical protein
VSVGRPFRATTEHPQLVPHVPIQHLSDSYFDLAPSSESQLWYALEDLVSIENSLHARMSFNWIFPTLVLDHTTIAHETCQDGFMTVTLDTLEAFDYVQQQWAPHPQMVFVSADHGCAEYENKGHRTFFASQSYSFDRASRSVVIQGDYKQIEDVASTGQLDCKWGFQRIPNIAKILKGDTSRTKLPCKHP